MFDFGGGHSVYEDEAQFTQVRNLLAPYPHVVLVIPSPDVEESVHLLHARNEYESNDQREVNEHLVRHHSNYDLAKHIAYTKDKEPEQACDEILRWAIKTGGIYERPNGRHQSPVELIKSANNP